MALSKNQLKMLLRITQASGYEFNLPPREVDKLIETLKNEIRQGH